MPKNKKDSEKSLNVHTCAVGYPTDTINCYLNS